MKTQKSDKKVTGRSKRGTASTRNSKRTTGRKQAGQFYGVRQSRDGVTFAAFYPNATTIQIAGDFNNWRPEEGRMEKVDDKGIWRLNLKLSPGTYHYRIVVDGNWQQDPHNEASEPNPYGELNSVLKVE